MKRISLDQLTEVIEKLERTERMYCDVFCYNNPEHAAERRKQSNIASMAYWQVYGMIKDEMEG